MTVLRSKTRTNTDRDFLELAAAERMNSDDPKAQFVLQSGVGALIVSAGGEIIARSANVIPPNLKSSPQMTISEFERYHFIEHAERAAIYSALAQGRTLVGSTIYCTRFPCSDCARAIVWAGISRAVFSTGLDKEARWKESQRAARHILTRSGVTVRILRPIVRAVNQT